MPKRTYQPKKRKRIRKHGFRALQKKKSGKREHGDKSVVQARSAKGREKISSANHPRYK